MKKKHIEVLLQNVKTLLKHKREKEILLGESFNVFSIIGLENNENRTHSAFIAELLNPEGSHYKGSIFLKHFINAIDYTGIFNPDTAVVTKEHHIGEIDPKKETGGRIDIYLIDNSGNIISIENKLNAGDQECQIQRYCSHSCESNKVYYLTKHGKEPDGSSKGSLVNGKDFFTISYQEHILNWLNACYRECPGDPILRETLRQYIVLIKKITKTMENKDHDELIRLMLNNFEAASFISSNYKKAYKSIGEEVRQGVIQQLEGLRGNNFIIKPGSNAMAQISQIWIKSAKFQDSPLYYGVESFSGEGNHEGNMFVGIFNDSVKKYRHISGWKYTKRWNDINFLPEFSGLTVNFSNIDLILKLMDTNSLKMELVNHIATAVSDYIKNKNDQLNLQLEMIPQ